MRVGILTLHSQINYGGVLQCLALQTILQGMGHDVVIIDRWMHAHREGLDGVFAKGIGWKEKIKGYLLLLWPRFAMRQIRQWRTRKFIQKHLQLTNYHFSDWKDAPRDLGVDVIVVGSDQVWHGGDFGDPQIYLLEDAPLKRPDGTPVKAVAYAASFGMPEIPSSEIELYKRGLARFAAVSVRENSGIELALTAGRQAVTVLDPTLLLSPEKWKEIVTANCKTAARHKDGRHLVCYLLNQDLEEILPLLEGFGKRNACTVSVITAQLRPHLTSRKALRNYLVSLFGFYQHVRLMFSAGPGEFLHLFSMADYCITDSFHALMFSSIFNVNCRILAPQAKVRQRQFSRIKDFAEFVEGPLFSANVKSAIDSIDKHEKVNFLSDKIISRRKYSINWLDMAL